MEHWADQFKQATGDTLEGKIYRAACYLSYPLHLQEQHEKDCRAVGQLALENNCSIWHAAWLYRGSVGQCRCAPCQKKGTQ